MPGEAHSFGHNLTATDSVIGCVVRAARVPSRLLGCGDNNDSRFPSRESALISRSPDDATGDFTHPQEVLLSG
jgi:hypothetical protein